MSESILNRISQQDFLSANEVLVNGMPGSMMCKMPQETLLIECSKCSDSHEYARAKELVSLGHQTSACDTLQLRTTVTHLAQSIGQEI